MDDDTVKDHALVSSEALTGEGEDQLVEPLPAGEDEPEPGLLDRFRGTGVGVEDPNIVGDAGPTDVPPGRDSAGDGLLADGPVPD